MASDPVRVLVLYRHPLMGEGLGRMLAEEPGVEVDAVDMAVREAVDAALAREPAVIVIEEGGGVDAADVVRRTTCAAVFDVDIGSTDAWSLRREAIRSRPEEFVAAIRGAIDRIPDPAGDRRPPDAAPKPDPGHPRLPASVAG